MRSSGPLYFSILDANQGDLYAQLGVRWVVLADGEVPSWAGLHAREWAARRLVIEALWGRGRVGLYRLP